MFKNISAVSALVLFILLHAWLAVAANQKLLEDITFEPLSENEERITFKLNGTYIPKIFAIKGEKPRVVFDFPDTKPARVLNNIINTNGKFIKRIRIGIHEEPHPKTRVVFDLLPDKKIDFKQDFDRKKNALIITVHDAGTEPVSIPSAREEKKTVPPEKTAAPPEPETKSTPPEDQPQTVPEKEKTPKVTPSPLPAPVPVVTQPAKPVAPEQQQPEVQQQPEAKQSEPQPVAQKPVKQASVPAKTAITGIPAGPPLLSSVTFDDSTNRGEMVLFKLNKFHPPVVSGVEEGLPRVICDFKGTAAADDLPSTIKTDGQYVHTIRISREKTPQKVRVVLDLAPSNSYDLQQVFFKDDNLFVIIVNTLNNAPPAEELEKPLK